LYTFLFSYAKNEFPPLRNHYLVLSPPSHPVTILSLPIFFFLSFPLSYSVISSFSISFSIYSFVHLSDCPSIYILNTHTRARARAHTHTHINVTFICIKRSKKNKAKRYIITTADAKFIFKSLKNMSMIIFRNFSSSNVLGTRKLWASNFIQAK